MATARKGTNAGSRGIGKRRCQVAVSVTRYCISVS